MKRILLTGANGFIGSNILSVLKKKNFDVDCIVRKNEGKISGAIIHDLKYEFNPNPIIKYDCIIHAAATSPKKDIVFENYFFDNISATKNLINFANKNGIKKIIFLSSISVLGEIRSKEIDETTSIIDPSDYGLSKYLCEKLLFGKNNKFKSISLRLPGVLGEKSVRNLLTMILNKAKNNEIIDIYKPNSKFNNCIDVNDLSLFICQLIDFSFNEHDVFPVAAKDALKIIDIVSKIIDRLKSASKINIIKNDISSFIINNAYAIDKYDYKPNTVDLIINNFIERNR